MSRLIFNNDSKLTDTIALQMILGHIEKGLISHGTYGKQYCHLITWGDPITHVTSCDKRKTGTYSFRVSEYNTTKDKD